MVRFRDSIKKWKGKFFFVKVTELGDWAKRVRWRESVKMTDHIPALREYDGESVGRISRMMLDVRELQEPLLYAATLSPMPIERAGQLMYGGKRMSLPEWVEIRSLELQTKEKQKVANKGEEIGTVGGQYAAETRGDRLEITGKVVGDGGTEAGKIFEVDVPLVQKRKKLVKSQGDGTGDEKCGG